MNFLFILSHFTSKHNLGLNSTALSEDRLTEKAFSALNCVSLTVGLKEKFTHWLVESEGNPKLFPHGLSKSLSLVFIASIMKLYQ